MTGVQTCALDLTSLVSVSGKYIREGTIDTIGFWDPALAGKAMVQLTVNILDGKDVTDGLDLGIEGLQALMARQIAAFCGRDWPPLSALFLPGHADELAIDRNLLHLL